MPFKLGYGYSWSKDVAYDRLMAIIKHGNPYNYKTGRVNQTKVAKMLKDAYDVPTSKYRKKRKFSKNRYFTTGKYTGTVSKGNYKKGKLNVPFVVQNATEIRGSLNDPDGMYLGCGPDFDELFTAWCKCVIHCLFAEAGVTIESWESVPVATSAYLLTYTVYQNFTSTAVTSRALAFAIGDSFETLASKFKSDIQVFIAANRFHRFATALLAISSLDFSSKINFDNFKYKVFVSNNLLIQNRTLSGVTTGDDDDNLTNNVTNNPLHIRFFNCKGNALIANSKSGQNTLFSWTSPIITQLQSTVNLSDRHIDNSKFINAKISKSFVLDPGSIKNIKNSWSEVLYPSKIYSLLKEQFDSSISTDYSRKMFGKISLVGVDKVLKADAAEHDIDIGYELNTKLSMGYRYRKYSIPPSTFVQ